MSAPGRLRWYQRTPPGGTRYGLPDRRLVMNGSRTTWRLAKANERVMRLGERTRRTGMTRRWDVRRPAGSRGRGRAR